MHSSIGQNIKSLDVSDVPLIFALADAPRAVKRSQNDNFDVLRKFRRLTWRRVAASADLFNVTKHAYSDSLLMDLCKKPSSR